jgi:hypothetical protein
MPFQPTYRDYTTGDFIFGINASIEQFKTTGPAHGHLPQGAKLSKTPITVRELSLDRQNVANTFSGERATLNNSYLDALQNHPKYHTAYNVTTPGNVQQPDGNKVFRAKSKEGLNYCIANHQHLHFVLDGLDLAEVMGKSRQGEFKNSATDKVRTVTGAELRWLYRNRLSPDTQEYVQFWIDGQQCCPPWELDYQTIVPNSPVWTYVPKGELTS